jgi:hypothetical protein
VSAISERAKHPDAKKLFGRCRSELRSSYELFKNGKSVEGQRKIRKAKKLFDEAGKLRRTKSPINTDIKTSAVPFRQVNSREVQRHWWCRFEDRKGIHLQPVPAEPSSSSGHSSRSA